MIIEEKEYKSFLYGDGLKTRLHHISRALRSRDACAYYTKKSLPKLTLGKGLLIFKRF